jgi:hypothetical protein
MVWKEYFSLYPFSQERQERSFAMLASLIANISGKTLNEPLHEDFFMPDYLNEREQVEVVEKSIEQQTEEALVFRQRLQKR